MSNMLWVIQFGGQPVGTITQASDGTLIVQGATAEHEQALRKLITDITAAPLPYLSGREVETKDGPRSLTIQTLVQPGSPHYLSALADALPKHRLLGQRIRGVVRS